MILLKFSIFTFVKPANNDIEIYKWRRVFIYVTDKKRRRSVITVCFSFSSHNHEELIKFAL